MLQVISGPLDELNNHAIVVALSSLTTIICDPIHAVSQNSVLYLSSSLCILGYLGSGYVFWVICSSRNHSQTHRIEERKCSSRKLLL